jgi:uncharacterized membrane protein
VPDLPLQQEDSVSAEMAPEAVGQTCTICQTSIASGEAVTFCRQCKLAYHADCWQENGGCAVYGCDQAPKHVKSAESSLDDVARRGWGNTKQCPYCGENIRSAALKCKFCHEVFENAEPITSAEIDLKQLAKLRGSAQRSKAVVYLIFSILSCAAPVMALLGLIWVFWNRKKFKAMDMSDQVMVYAGLGASLLVSVIMLLSLVFSAIEGS